MLLVKILSRFVQCKYSVVQWGLRISSIRNNWTNKGISDTILLSIYPLYCVKTKIIFGSKFSVQAKVDGSLIKYYKETLVFNVATFSNGQ